MQCDEGKSLSPDSHTSAAASFTHSLTRAAVVWQVINQGHCAFRVKTVEQNFCRNENNVTGLCNRQSCPLANSRYATIREVEGKCYLYMKTIERSFSPAKMWDKIKLSSDYAVALQQLDEHLQYRPQAEAEAQAAQPGGEGAAAMEESGGGAWGAPKTNVLAPRRIFSSPPRAPQFRSPSRAPARPPSRGPWPSGASAGWK